MNTKNFHAGFKSGVHLFTANDSLWSQKIYTCEFVVYNNMFFLDKYIVLMVQYSHFYLSWPAPLFVSSNRQKMHTGEDWQPKIKTDRYPDKLTVMMTAVQNRHWEKGNWKKKLSFGRKSNSFKRLLVLLTLMITYVRHKRVLFYVCNLSSC